MNTNEKYFLCLDTINIDINKQKKKKKKNSEHSHFAYTANVVDMCVWEAQVQTRMSTHTHTDTNTHTHTHTDTNTHLALTPAACPPDFSVTERRERGGGGYYSSAVINIRCTFSAMQSCWWGLVIDGGGHYISLALVYLSHPPQDTNKPCCLQWTIQHRSTRIENRCCASHLCYWHSRVPEGPNKQPPPHWNIWIMALRPATTQGIKLLRPLLLMMWP